MQSLNRFFLLLPSFVFLFTQKNFFLRAFSSSAFLFCFSPFHVYCLLNDFIIKKIMKIFDEIRNFEILKSLKLSRLMKLKMVSWKISWLKKRLARKKHKNCYIRSSNQSKISENLFLSPLIHQTAKRKIRNSYFASKSFNKNITFRAFTIFFANKRSIIIAKKLTQAQESHYHSKTSKRLHAKAYKVLEAKRKSFYTV